MVMVTNSSSKVFIHPPTPGILNDPRYPSRRILIYSKTKSFKTGVVYAGYDREKDVLVNGDQCQTDAGLIKQLGANTIRVFSADSTQNHDACMNTFASQGIYVWLDLWNGHNVINYVNITSRKLAMTGV